MSWEISVDINPAKVLLSTLKLLFLSLRPHCLPLTSGNSKQQNFYLILYEDYSSSVELIFSSFFRMRKIRLWNPTFGWDWWVLIREIFISKIFSNPRLSWKIIIPSQRKGKIRGKYPISNAFEAFFPHSVRYLHCCLPQVKTLATYPYAIKNQRKARNAPRRGLWVPWAGSLWH